MSCDIHVILEVRKDSSRTWRLAWGPWSLGQDYRAFGRLAGVREESEPHIPPRGLPEDCTPETRRRLSDRDIHTQSWLTAQEFKDAAGPFAQPIWGDIEEHLADGREVRVVFGFDS